MKTFMILLLISSLFLIPSQVSALSCAEPLPVEIAFDEYDAVLIGSVETIKTTSSARTLTIQVETSFKGVDENRITVLEDVTWGESREGATYLFFLTREEGKWLHPLCSPTTHNTDLTDEFLADKEIITLHEVESTDTESNNRTFYILLSLLLAVIAGAGVWKVFAKQKRKT